MRGFALDKKSLLFCSASRLNVVQFVTLSLSKGKAATKLM
jgi:hypothetical protein